MNPSEMFTLEFYRASSSIIALGVGSLFLLLQTLNKSWSKATGIFVSTLFFLVVAMSTLWCCAPFGKFLNGAYVHSPLNLYAQSFILLISLVVVLLMQASHLRESFFRGEIASLYIMIIMGMLLMVSSEDLVTLFVGMEMSAIGIYALVGYVSPNRYSQEGAIKYLVLGSFASCLFLFGSALVYLGTGSLNIDTAAKAHLDAFEAHWVNFGSIFLMIGIAFKLGLAPFHHWSPDAYEAAPTPVTALMATGVKVMMIFFLIRLMPIGFDLGGTWGRGFGLFAGASIVVGNVLALVQTSLKRMLAYSSIAHTGYMAIAISALGTNDPMIMQSILFYLLGYSLSSLLAFGILTWLEREGMEQLHLRDLGGLAKVHPWAAGFMTFALFSLAGIPPTVGFINKFFLFQTVLKYANLELVILAVVGSTISLYYYLRPMVFMYMDPKTKYHLSSVAGCNPGNWFPALLFTLSLANLIFGILPEFIIHFLAHM